MTSQQQTDQLTEDALRGALEAILLVVDSPISADELSPIVDAPATQIDEILEAWSDTLTSKKSGLDVRHTPEGWRIYSRDLYAPYVEKVLVEGGRANLSQAALEALAVIAYRQPVTRSQVSAVRGVNVDGVIRTLLTRGLIIENGFDADTGAQLLCTTSLFLDELGIDDLSALPDLAPLLPEVDLIDEIEDEATQQAVERRRKVQSKNEPEKAENDT